MSTTQTTRASLRILFVSSALGLTALAGCAGSPGEHILRSGSWVMTPISNTRVRDARAEFRAVFCEVFEATGEASAERGCGDWLLDLGDEPVATRTSQPALKHSEATAEHLTIVFVAGLVSDCLDQAETAKEEFKEYLAERGHRFEMLDVSGISSSAANAAYIDEMLSQPEFESAERIVLVGHSKGVVDILEALVRFPRLRARVTAVVSLAGAIGGSPLADLAPDIALSVVRRAPGVDCRDGDGEALNSLRPEVRRQWLAHHTLPAGIAYYSMVSLPTHDRLSAGLKSGHRMLGRYDVRNDGNLLFYDQVIPGSTLLGYANADHWAIATNLGDSSNPLVRALANKSDFPRRILMTAILQFLLSDLPDRAGER